ncbi:MAG: restriction endonuclease subunit S [Prevotella sp.]|nr:restriction endonuclease subunit S [Prevotella sp.]
MSEWKEYKLGDLTIDGKGSYGIAAPAVEYDANKYTYLRITDINDDGTINKNGLKSVDDKNASNYLLKPNDIVFARTGASVGRSYFYDGRDGELVYAGFLIKYSLDSTKVNPKLLKFYTHSQVYYDWIQTVDNGATRGNINAQTYASMPVLLPDRNKQDEIVSILSSLDDKIDLLNRENATLEAMAETLFRQWFIEDAKEDWEEVTLEDVALLNAGGDKPKIVSQNRTKELNVPIYSNGIDNEGLYGYTDKPRITEESVTISARGTIGYVALRTAPFVPIVRLITIRPKERVTSKFLYFWAKSQDINGTGTTQQQLTVPDFKLTKLVLPDKAVIDDFTKIVNQYYDKIISNKKQIQTLIYTRDGLLPKLMSNEISI